MLVSQLQKSSTWCGYILNVLGSLAIVAWNSWYPRVLKESSRPGYNPLSEGINADVQCIHGGEGIAEQQQDSRSTL